VRALPLSNVAVEQVRVQDATGSFDTITARAFSNLADMLAWGGHLLADEGRWLALKGRIDQDEIAGVPDDFRVVAVRQVRVPGTEADRCVIELARS